MEQSVILVDQNDSPIGQKEKLAAHRAGDLHRAFSVFVFNSSGELLLQKRAKGKYHSGGLWTNTCCSHPEPREETESAAHRRLQEEMGFDCPLKHVGALLYKTHFDNGLTEYEYDHMFVGTYDGPIHNINPLEVEGWQWMNTNDTLVDIEKNPEHYSYWFRLALHKVLEKFSKDENII
jgi:isopentenyl-diphosphate delta-isomerase